MAKKMITGALLGVLFAVAGSNGSCVGMSPGELPRSTSNDGEDVGALVKTVGCPVGDVGDLEGNFVGDPEGANVSTTGDSVGDDVGDVVGAADGVIGSAPLNTEVVSISIP